MSKKQCKLFIFCTLLVFSSTAIAKEAILEKSSPNENTASENQNKFTYERVQNLEITPAAGPAVSNGADIYIQADYIYWYASELGVNYVGSNFYLNQTTFFKGQSPQSDYTAPKGRVYTPGNKASSGFKVGMGIDFDYDGWDLGVIYTWYRNHHQSSVAAPLNAEGKVTTNLAPIIYQEYFDGSHLVYADSSLKLDLNVIDLELAREFYISPKLILRPYLGSKATWGRQEFLIHETLRGERKTLYPFEASESSNLAESFYTTANKQGNWGFGMRCGMDMSWLFTKSFSLYGKASITLLWQYLRAERVDLYNSIEDLMTNEVLLTNYQDVNYHQRVHVVNPIFETQIGLRYDYLFSEERYRFRAQLGWECQAWLGQNVFLTQYGDGQNVYDLTLQGLTAQLRLDF